jgi:hypothetical protein
MEAVVFLMFSSSIISMLRGTNHELCIQKVYLGSLLTDPIKNPNISISLFRISFFVRVGFENFQFYKCYENTINI